MGRAIYSSAWRLSKRSIFQENFYPLVYLVSHSVKSWDSAFNTSISTVRFLSWPIIDRLAIFRSSRLSNETAIQHRYQRWIPYSIQLATVLSISSRSISLITYGENVLAIPNLSLAITYQDRFGKFPTARLSPTRLQDPQISPLLFKCSSR